jgi:hypothetical protein
MNEASLVAPYRVNQPKAHADAMQRCLLMKIKRFVVNGITNFSSRIIRSANENIQWKMNKIKVLFLCVHNSAAARWRKRI